MDEGAHLPREIEDNGSQFGKSSEGVDQMVVLRAQVIDVAVGILDKRAVGEDEAFDIPMATGFDIASEPEEVLNVIRDKLVTAVENLRSFSKNATPDTPASGIVSRAWSVCKDRWIENSEVRRSTVDESLDSHL